MCGGNCPAGEECGVQDGDCLCLPTPLACTNSETPSCDGDCPVGSTCEEGLLGCECVAGTLCGGTAPECSGACPTNEACGVLSDNCSCLPVPLACTNSATPSCSGDCPVGSTCEQGLSGCECILAPLCGGTAPTCSGDCPIGEACGVEVAHAFVFPLHLLAPTQQRQAAVVTVLQAQCVRRAYQVANV